MVVAVEMAEMGVVRRAVEAAMVTEMAMKAMEVMMDAAAGTELAAMATEMGHVAAA